MESPFIPLSVPSLKGNELKYVTECIETEWVSSAGRFVNRFESEVSAYLGGAHAVACVNGTAALHMALKLSGTGDSDEVVVPTLTFIAPVNVVRYVNAEPVFMDCDDYLNLDPEKLADFLEKECTERAEGLFNKKSGRRIRAIMVVHVFGHPANLAAIMPLADRYRLSVIEDATESIGSYYRDWQGSRRHAGTIGHIGCLSFNGNKLLTTGGGGMLVTADRALAEKARYLMTQAKDDPERYVHHEIGYNYRLTNVQAAIGCAQLEQLERFLQIKRDHFHLYREMLGDVNGLRFITEPDYSHSNYWFYTLVVDPAVFPLTAVELNRKLNENRVESRFIWQLNHRQRPYRTSQSYQIAKAAGFHANGINLPCSVGLSPDTIRRICEIIKGCSR